jgi:hypothetical protein
MNKREKREHEYYSQLAYMLADKRVLDDIARTVSSGDRVEIVATREGLKFLRVRKKEIHKETPL